MNFSELPPCKHPEYFKYSTELYHYVVCHDCGRYKKTLRIANAEDILA